MLSRNNSKSGVFSYWILLLRDKEKGKKPQVCKNRPQSSPRRYNAPQVRRAKGTYQLSVVGCQWSAVGGRLSVDSCSVPKKAANQNSQIPANKGGEQAHNSHKQRRRTNSQSPANNSDELNLRPKQNGTLRATKVIKLPSNQQIISLNIDVKRGKEG